jgi:hypothetical protein
MWLLLNFLCPESQKNPGFMVCLILTLLDKSFIKLSRLLTPQIKKKTLCKCPPSNELKPSLNFCRCKNVENYGSFSSLKAPGNSSSLSGKSNFRYNYRNRTPFHKRYTNCFSLTVNRDLFYYGCRFDSSLSNSKDRYSNQPTSSKSIRFVIFALFFFLIGYTFIIFILIVD